MERIKKIIKGKTNNCDVCNATILQIELTSCKQRASREDDTPSTEEDDWVNGDKVGKEA